MCGIAGLADPLADPPDLETIGRDFVDRLRHRGPDGSGFEVVPELGLVLAHTRLAILDTTESAAQPMASPDGRYLLSYNGEIYNHLELRAALGSKVAASLRSHGDTETLVAAIARWGLAETLKRCRGMFAIAVLDRERQTVSLARDRFGQKPLYHGMIGRRLVFMSDLVALGPMRTKLTIDRRALDGYLRAGAVPGRRSMFERISRVMPGEIVTYDLSGSRFEPITAERYWSYEDEILRAIANPFRGSFNDAVDELDRIVLEAVGLRLLSDVPIGSLLSGGIDSSLVTVMMQRAASSPVKTFTAAFPGHAEDESAVAAEVASIIGTNHEQIDIGHGELMAVLPQLTKMNGEPFADPSQIPTQLVCRMARRSVTVCLTGDGGDEMFGGYRNQRRSANLIRSISRLPSPFRRGLASAAGLFSESVYPLHAGFGRSARTAAAALNVVNPVDARLALSGCWKEGEIPLAEPFAASAIDATDWPELDDVEQQMMWYDGVTFLPDQVLFKVDRASMCVSLEARAPLLDHEVVRFAWSLPTDWRVGPDDGPLSGKWILRRLLDRTIPRQVMDRPKQGFSPPIGRWLRGELSEWAGDLLSPARLQADGFLDSDLVGRAWAKHQEGSVDDSRRLWAILMFQAWLDEIR